MVKDTHHLQIRTTHRVRENIRRLASAHHRSTADIVRSALELGLKLLDKLLQAQSDMVIDYMRLLKKESRLKSGKDRGQNIL